MLFRLVKVGEEAGVEEEEEEVVVEEDGKG